MDARETAQIFCDCHKCKDRNKKIKIRVFQSLRPVKTFFPDHSDRDSTTDRSAEIFCHFPMVNRDQFTMTDRNQIIMTDRHPVMTYSECGGLVWRYDYQADEYRRADEDHRASSLPRFDEAVADCEDNSPPVKTVSWYEKYHIHEEALLDAEDTEHWHTALGAFKGPSNVVEFNDPDQDTRIELILGRVGLRSVWVLDRVLEFPPPSPNPVDLDELNLGLDPIRLQVELKQNPYPHVPIIH